MEVCISGGEFLRVGAHTELYSALVGLGQRETARHTGDSTCWYCTLASHGGSQHLKPSWVGVWYAEFSKRKKKKKGCFRQLGVESVAKPAHPQTFVRPVQVLGLQCALLHLKMPA